MKLRLLGIASGVALSLLVILISAPLTLAQQAQQSKLVTCTGVDCNFCHLLSTGKNVIDLLFQVLIIAAVVMIVVAGFKLVTSAGNVSAMQSAKGMLTNVIIGFVIVLSAWLIVDTIIKMLVGQNSQFGMWNQFSSDCGGARNTSIEPTAGPTHEQIREQIREQNPNVGLEYTLGPGESYGSTGHTTYVKNCIDSGGSVAQKVNSNNTLECRYPPADAGASGGNNLYCYATQGQSALTCVQALSECERYNALAAGEGQIVSGCFAQARPQN